MKPTTDPTKKILIARATIIIGVAVAVAAYGVTTGTLSVILKAYAQ